MSDGAVDMTERTISRAHQRIDEVVQDMALVKQEQARHGERIEHTKELAMRTLDKLTELNAKQDVAADKITDMRTEQNAKLDAIKSELHDAILKKQADVDARVDELNNTVQQTAGGINVAKWMIELLKYGTPAGIVGLAGYWIF